MKYTRMTILGIITNLDPRCSSSRFANMLSVPGTVRAGHVSWLFRFASLTAYCTNPLSSSPAPFLRLWAFGTVGLNHTKRHCATGAQLVLVTVFIDEGYTVQICPV